MAVSQVTLLFVHSVTIQTYWERICNLSVTYWDKYASCNYLHPVFVLS